MNMFHYYAFTNEEDCVVEAFKNKQAYLTDKFTNTPLKYALDRQNYKCVNQFISVGTDNSSFYSDMTPIELKELMKADPAKLPMFFERATETFTSKEKFGVI